MMIEEKFPTEWTMTLEDDEDVLQKGNKDE